MKRIKVEWVIILLSILLLIVVVNLPFNAQPLGDLDFHVQTKACALYLKGILPYSKVFITKAPGPVLFFLPAYLLAPSNGSDYDYWLRGVISTSVLITISMIWIYYAASNLFGKRTGLLTVFLFFIFPLHIYYTFGITAEAPAFFSIALGIWGWSRLKKDLSIKNWILFITGIILCICNRPNSIIFIGFGFLILIISYFKNKEFFNRYFKGLSISLCIIVLVSFGILKLAKIITADKINSDQAELLSYVAHQGRFQFRHEPADLRYWESDIRPDSKDYQEWIASRDSLRLLAKETNIPVAKFYNDYLIKDLKINYPIIIRSFFVKCFYGQIYIINSLDSSKFRLGPLKGNIGYFILLLIINVINILILLGFFIYLIKVPNKIEQWPLWVMFVSLLIFHGLLYMEPRYLLPSKPGIYILSAFGLLQIPFINRIFSKIDKFFSINTIASSNN